jgi:hypothetical protein
MMSRVLLEFLSLFLTFFIMKNALKIFLVIAILLLPATTFASSKSMKEQSVSIEIGDDFYSAGGLVELKEVAEDDAYLAGAVVNVDKKVTNDLVVAGSSLTIISEIGDDLRAGGSVVTLASTVAGDAVIGGGMVNILESSVISGDAVIGGGLVNFGGSVIGDLQLAGDEIIFAGTVEGDTDIRIGKKIDFSEDAKITGKLTYFSDEEIEIPEGIASLIERKDLEEADFEHTGYGESGGWVVKKLFMFLTAFVAGAVLLVFCGKNSTTFANTVREKFWWSLLTGALVFFAPLLVILLLITMIGSYLAGIIFVAWLLLLLVSGALMGFLVGSLVLKQKEDTKYSKKILTLAIGLVIVLALCFIPVFGGIIKLTIFVITLGALVLSKLALYKQVKEAKLL